MVFFGCFSRKIPLKIRFMRVPEGRTHSLYVFALAFDSRGGSCQAAIYRYIISVSAICKCCVNCGFSSWIANDKAKKSPVTSPKVVRASTNNLYLSDDMNEILTADGQTVKTSKQYFKAMVKEAELNASIWPPKFRNKKALAADCKFNEIAIAAAVAAAVDFHPPITNRGGIGSNLLDDGTEKIIIRSKGHSGQPEVIRIPQPLSGVSSLVGFIDQVTFSVRVSEVLTREIVPPYGIDQYRWCLTDAVPRLSTVLLHIFGFAVTHQRERGINFYKQSYTIGDNDGILAIGGQADTVNVALTGQGCMKAKEGWQGRLKDYLEASGGWLTRCDVAADFFDGRYSPVKAEIDFINGDFSRSKTGTKPYAERRGDWYTDDGITGKTFYIGKRENGKLLRIYEKGKQMLGKIAALGIGEDHPLLNLLDWCRVELELHNRDRIIPFDILVNPGPYLAGSFPALNWIDEIQVKVKTFKKIVESTVERTQEVFRVQAGKRLWSIAQIHGIEEAFRILTRGQEKVCKSFEKLMPLKPEDDPDNLIFDLDPLAYAVPF